MQNLGIKFFGCWLWILCFSFQIQAQSIQVGLVIPPPVPSSVESLVTLNGQAIVTLFNNGNSSQTIKLLVSLEGNNGVKAKMLDSYQPSTQILLGPNESKVITGAMLQSHFSNLSENQIEYSGVDKPTLQQTEKLPEGSYLICVKAYDYNTGQLLSSSFSGCTQVLVSNYDAPMIILPAHGSEVTAYQPAFVNMAWTPSGIPGITRYTLELVDMDLNHLLNPNEAFDNIAILVHYKKDHITTSNFIYDATMPKLTVGHKYAMRVRAYDPQNNLQYKNKGKSPVISFTYKAMGIIQDPPKNNGVNPGNFDIKNQNNPQYNMAVCQEAVNIADKTAIAGQGIIKPYDIITIGKFSLKLTEVNWNGNVLSGKGKIVNSWLKVPILVEFSDLKVNKSKIVIEGTAKGRNDDNVPSDWINDLGNISFGGPQIQALINKLMGSPQRVMTWPYENMDSLGLGMPIGIKRNIGGAMQTVAIVGMVFTPQGAGLNAVAQVNIPSYNQKVSLAASGVCIDEKGFTKQAFLHLIEDLTLNQNGHVKMMLKKGQQGDNPTGTYLKMEVQGFSGMQLDGAFIIDSKVAKPVNPQLNKVEAPFKITLENPDNFILQNVSVTPFTLTKLPGFEMTITNLSIDHSDLQNPANISFPTNNYNTQGNLWRGFYFKEITVKIPPKFHPNQTISCQHFLIDQNGFSGILNVPVVFEKTKGEMGEKKWKYSMKNFLVKIIKNQFNEGKFNGEIRLPVTAKDIYVQYAANMSLSPNQTLLYNVSLINQNNIQFPAIFAKGSINPDTELDLKDVGNGFEPELHLYATLTFNRKYNYDIQGFKFDISDVEVQDLVISKEGVHLGPNGGFSHSYDADQRTLHGFDISIDEFTFKKKNEMFIAFSVSLVGEDNSVGGNASFSMLTSYKNDNMMDGSISLSEVGIHGDISVATFDGYIAIMNDDPVYGDGFQGGLDVKLNLGQGKSTIGGSVDIIFGNMPEQNNVDAYKYFFFKGEMFVGNGIPLTASLRLYGLKGGIYFNMVQDDPWKNPVPFKGSNKDTKFGLLAGVDIGLVSKKAFHAKPQFKVQFGTQSGLDIIQIFGDAYAFTDWKPQFEPYPENQIPIHISMDAKMDFKKKIFDFNSGITIQYPVNNNPLITAKGSIKMHVAGPQKWYIKIGEPGPSENIGVKINFIPLKKKHYFMAGYELPGMPPVPQEIMAKLGKPYQADRQDVTNGDNENLRFALGSLIDFSTGDLTAWIFYANFAAIMGYDVAMSKGWGDCGFNGWYLEGQAYAMLSAEVGIKAKIFKKERKFKVAAVSAGILAEAALPNPAWLHGMVYGEATFLNVIKGKFTFEVNYGEKCKVQPNIPDTDALEGLHYVQDISPKGKNVKVFSDPEFSTLFSIKENKVYTLTEYADNKEIERNFKFPIKKAVMKIDDPSSKENGKILAKWGDDKVEGIWKSNTNGDILKVESKRSLPPKTKITIDVEIEVREMINGNFVTIEANGTKKSHSFTTGADPDRIVDENIEELYPANGQRYYLQNDVFQKGFIQLKDDQDNIFVHQGPQMTAPKFIVKFIPVGGGQVVEGKFEGYQNNRVSFSHPKLANNKVYVFQLVKSNVAGTFQGNQPKEKELFLTSTDFKSNITESQKLLDELKTSAKEKEIYAFVFRTSMYNSLSEKLGKMADGDASMLSIYGVQSVTVGFTGSLEPFDKADVAQLKPEWYLGQKIGGPAISPNDKGKVFGNDYHKTKIVVPWNTIVKPKAYPNLHDFEVNYSATILNAQPLISQQEINQMLKQPANPGFKLNAPPKVITVQVLMSDCSKAHQEYNTLLAKMASPETADKATQRILKYMDYTLFNYMLDLIQDKNFLKGFSPPDKGLYHMVLHRNAAYHYRKAWKL